VIPIGPSVEGDVEAGDSEVRSFKVDYNPTMPTVFFPVPHRPYKYSVGISWKNVPHATAEYHLKIYKRNQNGNLITPPFYNEIVTPYQVFYQGDEGHHVKVSGEEAATHAYGYCLTIAAIGPDDPEGKTLTGKFMTPTDCYDLAPPVIHNLSPPYGLTNWDYNIPITFSWTHPDGTEGYPMKGYQVIVQGTNTGWSHWVDAPTTSYPQPVGPDQTYKWWVRAVGVNDNETISAHWTFTTKAAPQQEQEQPGGGSDPPSQECTIPTKPQNLSPGCPVVNGWAEPSPLDPNECNYFDPTGYVTYQWSPVSGATHYRIKIYHNEDELLLSEEITTSQYTVTGHLSTWEYHWQVQAKNACGTGPVSDRKAIVFVP